MRMMAYLGGDTNTLACRRAKISDIRLAVEFPDHDRMLVVSVMQTGEIVMAWSRVRGSEASEYIEVIGKVIEGDGELTFMNGFDTVSDFAPPTDEPVTFDHTILRVVPDPEDEYEPF